MRMNQQTWVTITLGNTERGRTDDPKEEEKGDEAWCQYRDHGLNRSTECAHRHPRHHPVNYEARTTIARETVVSFYLPRVN
jgi:hypothetical protein